MAAEPRQPTIEEIKKTGAENKPDGGVKEISRCVGIGRLKQRSLKYFQRGSEPAK